MVILDMNYKVIADQEDFLLIDKAPGVGFHNEEKQQGLTAILKSDGFDKLYPVHRLDKMTSGLILFAKTKEIAAELSRQFREKEIEKYYLAISDRKPKKKQGLILGDMVEARRGAWKLTTKTENPAVTQFFSGSIAAGLRIFILKPHTGKTHQLRVALKSIGAPVLGDSIYHPKDVDGVVADRGYLHSYALKFKLNEKEYIFTSMPEIGDFYLSEDFKAALKQFENPFELAWPKLKKRKSEQAKGKE